MSRGLGRVVGVMERGEREWEGAVPPKHEMGGTEQRARAVPGADLHSWGVCRVRGGFPGGFLVGPHSRLQPPCPSCARLLSLKQALEGLNYFLL